jgi:hypothetical protein
VTWRCRSRPARGRGAAARVLGWHVAWLRTVRGRPVRGTWLARAAAVERRENRGGEGQEVDEEGLFAIS